MSLNDKDDERRNSQRGGGEDESDSGGGSGAIEFRDFLSPLGSRDDLLSADEKKRLLIVHRDTHGVLVKKQKDLGNLRKKLKDGTLSLKDYRQGLSGGMSSNYKIHPISQKAQFSGIDRQVTALPTENQAETNQEQQEQLQYQYNLRHRPEQAPRFTPKLKHR